jgi:hypothetical protein
MKKEMGGTYSTCKKQDKFINDFGRKKEEEET